MWMHLPPYPVFPELQAGRYRLRQVLISDLDTMLDLMFYNGVPAGNVATAQEMLTKIDQDYAAGNGINWGIENQEDGSIMGTLGFYRGFKNETGELGCILKEGFRGKGIMAQAIKAVTTFGRQEMNLKTVCAFTKEQNIQAKALLNGIHFIQKPSTEAGYLYYEFLPESPENN